jgi:chorismate dehydratase
LRASLCPAPREVKQFICDARVELRSFGKFLTRRAPSIVRINYPVPSPSKLRVSAISFLNTAPLMWDFLHPPRAAELSTRYDVHFTLPNHCAAELASRSADIGLVPVAAYATDPNLIVIPDIAIASLNRVRSIILVTQDNRDLEDVNTVALDSTSRTSAALTRVLFYKFIGTAPRYIEKPPQLDEMLNQADAALLIGDPALLGREEAAERGWRCHDLAEIWRTHTGLPFVFAFWAMHSDVVAAGARDPAVIASDFQRSRDAGLDHLGPLLEEWTPRIPIPPEVIREYWTSNIHYSLDRECLEGLQLFFHYAAECDALPPAPPLRLLGA